MKVITIHEENHGLIGTATTMKAAFQLLIKENRLTPAFDLYDEATGVWYTLADVFESKGIEPTKKNILAWAMEYADDPYFWDGAFYFYEEALCEEEDWDDNRVIDS